MTILKNSLVNTPNLFPSQELGGINVTSILLNAHRAVGQPKSLGDARSAMFDLYVVLLWRKNRFSLAMKKLQLKRMAEQTPKGKMMLDTQLLREEVLRLLGFCRELLRNLVETPDLIHAHDEKKPRLLDKDELDRQDKKLINEEGKVRDLEVVIAVIGTISAGKSTCINAIVGADILPNRTTPMTTYPTKVRHDPARREPILEFPLADKFEAFVSDLKKNISGQLSQNNGDWDKVVNNKDDRNTAKELIDGKFDTIHPQSEGVDSIRQFMMTINDLSRLGGLENVGIATPPPLSSNGEPALPTLDVQFQHIIDDGHEGRLAILDTPGPNEAGQGDRLWDDVVTEVEQASAIIVVTDCTQLRTEATDKVEHIVNSIDKRLRDRIFVFANKFDELERYDWDEEDIQRDFALRLETAGLMHERIFPVKGRQAFLSNWAIRKIEIEKRLPIQGDPEWDHTVNFGKDAFGYRWESEIDDTTQVQVCAQRAWEDSLFEKPLEKVVRKAALNATQIALESGIDQAQESAILVDEFLKSHRKTNTQNASDLASKIAKFGTYITKIKSTRELVRKATQAPLNEFMNDVRTVVRETGEFVQAKITGVLSDHSTEHVFEGDFAEEGAQNLVNKIQKRLNKIFQKADKLNNGGFQAAITKVGGRVDGIVKQHLGSISKGAPKDLEETFVEVFDVQVQLPEPNIAAAATMSGTKCLGRAIKRSERTYTQRIQQRSFVGSVKRKIGDIAGHFVLDWGTDWGYDWKDFAVPTREVRFDRLENAALERNMKFGKYYESEAKKYAEDEVPSNLASYFDEVETYLQRFSGVLLDAQDNKKLRAEELQLLIDAVDKHLEIVAEILLDLDQINTGLKDIA